MTQPAITKKLTSLPKVDMNALTKRSSLALTQQKTSV